LRRTVRLDFFKSIRQGLPAVAERTEQAVILGVRQILSDRGGLASTLKACGFTAAELKQAAETTAAKARSYEQSRRQEIPALSSSESG